MASRSNVRFWAFNAGLWLFLIFTTQYFSQSPGVQARFQDDSDALVNAKILAELSISDELQQFGGFLHIYNPDAATYSSYLSQAGFQGTLLHYTYQLVQPILSAEAFLGIMRIGNALLFIVLLLVITFHTLGKHGLRTVAIAVSMLSLFGWITYFSTSLYWQIWGQFLPFVIAFLLYPRVLNRKLSFAAYCLILGALILFKALSGYEYITNVIAAPSVAVVYYGFREKIPLRSIGLQVIAIGIAGVVAFAIAFGLHLLQGSAYLGGSLQDMINVIASRASVRTFGEIPAQCNQEGMISTSVEYMINVPFLPYRIFSPIILLFAAALLQSGLLFFAGTPWASRVMSFLFSKLGRTTLFAFLALLVVATSAFLVITFSFPVLIGWLFLISGTALVTLLAYRLSRRPESTGTSSQADDIRALAVATAYSIPVSLTWLILATGHSACHFHINAITLFLPFGLMFAYLTALFLTRGHIFVGQSRRS
ncbi:MAG: hypothetical protein KME04_15285 [Pleurocapsa minor GSE-CHR-MK-17-07R]|jgi:hypothetical protein|nr:hypothetical protein [Pleurocapsa minor GSE-CHR-MK 17-07R]